MDRNVQTTCFLLGLKASELGYCILALNLVRENSDPTTDAFVFTG